VVASLSLLLWAGVLAHWILWAPEQNEAWAFVAFELLFVWVPLIIGVAVLELVLGLLGLRTASAAVGTVAGGLLLWLTAESAVVALEFEPDGSGLGLEPIGMAMLAVGAGQIVAAVLLLRGPWRVAPVLLAGAVFALPMLPVILPPRAAACPTVVPMDLPGRLVVVGAGSSRQTEFLPPGSVCVLDPRAGEATILFAPTAEDVRAGREWVNDPAVSADTGTVAFTWEDAIYFTSLDGADLEPSDGGLGPSSQPTWSPDGRLAFVLGHEWGTSAKLAILSPDDGRVHRLMTLEVPANTGAHPRWSPSGETIAVAVEDPDTWTEDPATWGARIVIVSLDGSVRPLTQGTQPAWSPDGTTIAFALRDDHVPLDDESLWLDDEDAWLDDEDAWLDDEDAWLDDGLWLRSRIMLIDAGGGTPRELGGTPEYQEAPVWSPDGAWIAYVSHDDEGETSLYVQPAGGGEARLLARGLYSTVVSWVP
jgi:hypothetical protein